MIDHTQKEAKLGGKLHSRGAYRRGNNQRTATETSEKCLSDEFSHSSIGDDDFARNVSKCEEGPACHTAKGTFAEFPAAKSILLSSWELCSEHWKSSF